MNYKILKPFWTSHKGESHKGAQQYRPNWDTEFKADEFSPSYVDWLIDEGYIQKVVENKRWRAECNSVYWYINSFGAINWCAEQNDKVDNFRYKTGNYFKTEEEAEEYKEAIEIEA